jgi:hypothetical protein
MSNNIMMKQPYNGDVPIGQLAKAIALVSAGGLLFGPASALATPLGPTGELIQNGGFGTNATPSLQNWTKALNSAPSTTPAINARASTDTINTSTGNAGFNSAFTSAFAVLGDQTGTITPAGDTATGDLALTQQITLAASYNAQLVVAYDLVLSFASVFDGLDTSGTADDSFRVTLLDETFNEVYTLSINSGGFPVGQYTTVNLFDAQDVSGQTVFSINGVLPGIYHLQFRVVEASSTLTNTAAGIDNVTLSGTMYTPEPGLLSLLGVGLGALGWSRRRSA